jgi:hypothetical protein
MSRHALGGVRDIESAAAFGRTDAERTGVFGRSGRMRSIISSLHARKASEEMSRGRPPTFTMRSACLEVGVTPSLFGDA